MKQIITKNRKVVCTTSVPYTQDEIKEMKKAGYNVREAKEDKNDKLRKD